MSLGGPVLRRELQRLSRRRATWSARLVVIALAFALLGSARVVHGTVEVTDLSWVADSLFSQLRAGLVTLVVLLAPLAAAFAVEEERVDGTLDLLTITPMGTGTLLWGKVGSRLAHTLSLALATLPAVAWMTSFGAIDPMQVLLLGVHLLLTAALLAQVATCLVVGLRGAPILAAAGAVAWFAVAALPGGLARAVDPAFVAGPLYGLERGDPLGLTAVIVWAPVLAGLGWLGPTLFRLTTGAEADDELGLLSSELWRFRRVERHLLWTVPGLVGLLFFVLLGAERVAGGRSALFHGAFGLWVFALVLAIGLTLPLWMVHGGRWVRTQAHRGRRAMHLRRTARGERRAVRGSPLRWRLLRTAAGGRTLARAMWGLWALVLPLTLYGMGRVEGTVVAGMAAWCGAMVVAALHPLATGGLDASWRHRDLLTLAGVRAGAVVRSHMGAALQRAIPLALVGGAMVVLGLMEQRHGDDLAIALGLAALVPAACAWLAATSTATGLLASRRRRWPLGIVLALGIAFAPPFLEESLPGSWALDLVLETWQPLVGNGRTWGTRVQTLLVATLFHLAMAAGVTLAASTALARRSGPRPASR